MEFLLNAFIRKIRGYRIGIVSLVRSGSGYDLYLYDIPTPLDASILKTKIAVHRGYETRQIEVKRGNKKFKRDAKVPNIEMIPIGEPVNSIDYALKVALNKETYAMKLNKLDVLFRDYKNNKLGRAL